LFAELLSNTLHSCCVGFGFVGLFCVKNLEFSMHTKCETIAGQYSGVGNIVSSRSYYSWSPPWVLTTMSLLQLATPNRAKSIVCGVFLWTTSLNRPTGWGWGRA